MDWMNNLFLVLILTTVTGSVFYLIGLIFGRIWSEDDSRVLRLQMRITQWSFLLPCVYFVLYIRERKRMTTAGSAVNLFYNTPMMQRVFAILGFVWITLFVVLIVRKLYQRHERMRIFDGNIPEEDAEVEAMFEEICDQLGIAGQVSLYRNDMVKMAYMLYWHGHAVVLPLKRYTREEMAVLLYHELCHYLNRDLYVKTVSCIVSLLHVINPLVPSMLKQLDLACEEYCDRCACQEGVELFSEKEYFQTILHVLNEEEKKERYNLLMLADTRSDFEKRVLCMKRFHERGGIKKGTALVLSICFLIGSSMAALLAGAGMAKTYRVAAQATDTRAVDSEKTLVDAKGVDAAGDGELPEELTRVYDLDADNVIVIGQEEIVTGACIYIDWALAPGKTGMTLDFSEDIGDMITATTMSDANDINYRMGIKDSNGLIRYVEGAGSIKYDFVITLQGEYSFFVTNLDSSRDLQIKGTVIE